MEDLNKLLAERDLLTRVVWYELNRFADTGQKISICVHEFLNGENKGKFCAEPTDIINQCKAEYLGIGDSVEEALKKCLTKIKGVSMDDILDADSQ